MKYLSIIFAFAFFSSHAQTNKIVIDLDSAVIITQKQFEDITIKYTSLLKKKKLSQISQKEHTEIIRVYNTTLKASEEAISKILFAYFIDAFYKTNYESEILKLYPDYVATSGNGHYLIKLRIELGGQLHKRSFFTIRN